MNQFVELKEHDLQEIDGGGFILMGCALVGGFVVGYAAAWYFG